MPFTTGINVDEEGLKTKLRSYRDVYRRELAKVLASEGGTGTATGELYVPKLVWFDLADSFLRSHVTIRKPRDNIEVRQRKQFTSHIIHTILSNTLFLSSS